MVLFDLCEILITEFDPEWRPRPSVAQRMGLDETLFVREWKKRMHARMTGAIPDYPSVLRAICHTLDHPMDEVLINRLYQQRLRDKSIPFQQIDDALLVVLRSIRSRGIHVGIISNCASEEVTAWDRCPIAPLVDVAIFSCDVGYLKPQRAIYGLACAELQAAPNECLFVGDGGSNELTGADAAGLSSYWATWFLDRWPDWKQEGEDRKRSHTYPRLSSFDDLERLIDRATKEVNNG